MPNKRIIWASEAVGFAGDGSTTYTVARGVQSVGITTSFNNEPKFQLGQLAIYENVENIPDVEVTMEKLADGNTPLWHLATQDAAGFTLAERINPRCTVALSLYPDTHNSASGVAVAEVTMSGLYASSWSLAIPVEGDVTESITLVGNHKKWKNGSAALFSGNMSNTDIPLALTYNSGGIQRRENVLFTYTTNAVDANSQVNTSVTNPGTILPPDVAGISTSGTNNLVAVDQYACSIQNLNVSVNLSREQILELGHKSPYFRYVQLPVDVTTEIECISKSGDWMSVEENGAYNGNNLRASTIKIALQDGTFLDLGTQNKCTNLTMGGGDTGGANQTLSYTFTTQNDLTIRHHQEV